MKMRQAVLLLTLVILLGACAGTSPKISEKRQITPPAPPFESEVESPELSVDITAPKRKYEREELARLPKLIGKAKTGLISPKVDAKPAEPAIPDKERTRIVLNFEKADVSEVTNQIFGDYLKLNYVLDPALQGRISVYLEGDFTKEELLQMVTKVYAANNISVVPRSGIYYIQPIQRSSSSSLPIATSFMLREEGGVRPVIVMYRLQYLDVKQAINTIKFFLTPGRPITSDTTTNAIIFVEDTENARTIVEVLKALDVNVLQEVSMEIVPLQAISPQDAVQSMEALMGKLGLFKESAMMANVAYIPLQNFGGVLMLAQNPELIKTAKQWLRALDVQSEEAGEQVHVYFVQNGLANEIGDILNQIFGLRGADTRARPEQQIVGATGARGYTGFGRAFGTSATGRTSGFGTSSSGFGGSTSRGLGTSSGFGSGTARGLGDSTTTTGQTTGTAARTGAMGTIGGARTGVGRVDQAAEPGTTLTGEVIIIPDETNNALVIRANAADYGKIKKTIETLDILPRAVLIEVVIAEVRLTKDLQYGIEWLFRRQDFQASFNGARLTNAIFDPQTVASAGLALFAGRVDNIAALITLLATKTDVNVLSAPTLLATDNKEASITVGGREPIPTGSAIGGGTADAIISTIQYEETGIILNVTPHINAGGLVRLEVEQTIRRTGDSVRVGSGDNVAPVFTERNVRTTLLAQNGSTVVIGGIIEENQNLSKVGIPFLMDIPLISPLFSTNRKNRDRTELLIAITPHVVDRKETEATREFLDRLRSLRSRIDAQTR